MLACREKGDPRQRARLLERFVRPDQGASAIEFALIVPFLLALAAGIIEMTNVFFVRSQLSEIVRDATRRLAVDAFTEEEARSFITAKLAETTNALGVIDVAETHDEEKAADDVTVSLDVPLRDILIFDFVANSFGGTADEPVQLSVAVTMLKY